MLQYLPVLLAAVGVALFLQGVVRLRRRGRADLAGWDRVALFGLGIAVTLVALIGPIDRLADTKYLAVHMLQHVLIGDLAPALMTTAVRGPLLVFLLPAPILAPIARSSRVRAVLSTLLRPRVAFGLWASNLAIWHVPYLYDLALRHQDLHDFEHLCWVFCGFLVWSLLVDPGAHRRLSVGGRLALGACMFAAGQVLSDVLIFSFGQIYLAYPGHTDQQLAGVAMMVEQLVTLSVLAFVLLRPRFRAARLVAA
ncbi:MAG: cytochrome c oxidase assembly protein [Actinobacteria bacterium]|nr:cytochrome c oxidase assembly protein [Actinomycetota bacterium]